MTCEDFSTRWQLKGFPTFSKFLPNEPGFLIYKRPTISLVLINVLDSLLGEYFGTIFTTQDILLKELVVLHFHVQISRVQMAIVRHDGHGLIDPAFCDAAILFELLES